MSVQQQYKSALDDGYSHEEIIEFLSTHPKYGSQVKSARDDGYTDVEISEYLSGSPVEQQEAQPSFLERKLRKPIRMAEQLGIGAAEMELLPYDLAASSLASKEAQTAAYRETLFEDIEQMMNQKMTGVWSEQDEELLQSRLEEARDPRKSDPYIVTEDFTVQGLAEKLTGQDLHPEDTAEKAARWLGFLKDPTKAPTLLKDLTKNGLSKNVLKEVVPGTKTLRAIGAGTALQLAEEEAFGPIGTIASAIIGDVVGMGTPGLWKAIKSPKETLGKITSYFSKKGNTKKEWLDQLVKDANAAGVDLDAGTLSNARLIKLAQTHAAESGLTGQALDNFRNNMSRQIIREYEAIGDTLAHSAFENEQQAAEAVREALKISEPDLNYETKSLLDSIHPEEFRDDYIAGETLKTVAEDIKEPIKEEINHNWERFNKEVGGLEAEQAELSESLQEFLDNNSSSLLLGESTPEAQVIRSVERLQKGLSNRPVYSLVKEANPQIAERIFEMSKEGRFVPEQIAAFVFNEAKPAVKDLERKMGMGIVEIVENISRGGQGTTYKPVSVSDLIATKRTLADVADWEFGGSNFKSAYKKIVGEIDNAIERTIHEANPQLVDVYEGLKAEYEQFKSIFENKNIIELFEPKSQNFNTLYNKYLKDPDKLRSLEDMLRLTERGNDVLNQVKRDYAERAFSGRVPTERDIRNISQTLGPQHREALEAYSKSLAETQPVKILPKVKGTPTQKKEAIATIRKERKRELFGKLKGKTEKQVMGMMDSVSGIRELQKALTGAEGRKLFDELKRYKLEEMIGRRMANNTKQQVKLGTFANLGKTTKERAILREILGKESYERLRRLQGISDRLYETAAKFMNPSKSGVRAADASIVATLGAGAFGLLSGNPWLLVKASAYPMGMRALSRLLSNEKFLKALEKEMIRKGPVDVGKLTDVIVPYLKDAAARANAYEGADEISASLVDVALPE